MIALLRKVNHDETRPSSDEERTPREEEIARMEVAIIRMPSSLPFLRRAIFQIYP